jgi:hypothetical protein
MYILVACGRRAVHGWLLTNWESESEGRAEGQCTVSSPAPPQEPLRSGIRVPANHHNTCACACMVVAPHWISFNSVWPDSLASYYKRTCCVLHARGYTNKRNVLASVVSRPFLDSITRSINDDKRVATRSLPGRPAGIAKSQSAPTDGPLREILHRLCH